MLSTEALTEIKSKLVIKAREHGFQDARVSDTSTSGYFAKFKQWVNDGFHGDMSFLERNQNLRSSPDELHPGTLRVVSLRYDYLPEHAGFVKPLKHPQQANVSRYALGRDYHKLMRKKLDAVCRQLQAEIETSDAVDYRVFVDSAPVLETSFAEKSGLGWKGKHSLIINKKAGSWFFLGEIFINLPLPIDEPVEDLCGNCSACISLCPTDAIIDSKKVDATRCISYLTIENKGPIPISLRSKMGNRIYGCDDCQLACPWNRYAQISKETGFQPKNNLDTISLLQLWQWNEKEFLDNFQGSPIRRIGYQNWLRNLAVAIGNSVYEPQTIELLVNKKQEANDLVCEHIDWAISQLKNRQSNDLTVNKKTQKLINCVTNMLPRDA
ncbi:tRNA epoxyqueuosine(34) reductase QueG [Aliikangiella coralliicola]|uniref:Epoxyqueuosine reductase n=2 Tax=Aliikangiella coralliicola TaxID=2592383 RepID=A0A545U546_9GAMM|nr:tRNA epoxyqueuosine(34) reductase QueG [Aliikangiella coralliicola]